MIASASRNLFSITTSLPRSICCTSPREQIADTRRELVANARALALANALDDPLLRCLRRRAAELGEVHRLFEHVADFEALVVDRASSTEISRLASVTSATTLRSRVILIAPRPSSISTSACTVGPYRLASAARMPSCSSTMQLGPIELLRIRDLFDRAQNVYGADHRRLPSLTM